MDRPASWVKVAVAITTSRVNAAKISRSRSWATGRTTWRRTRRPMPRIASTATATFTTAMPRAAGIDAAAPPSASTQTRNGPTDRSWISSTVKAERPKRVVMSPRSDSTCRTIAVEDSASPAPTATAAGPLSPISSATVAIATEVTMTWAAPSPRARPRISRMRSKGSSSPTVNSRNTTPSSARARIPSRSLTRPRPVGPITVPATR